MKGGSQLLFQVIANGCEDRSLVLIANLGFFRWGAVCDDDFMGAAVIDRLIHQADACGSAASQAAATTR